MTFDLKAASAQGSVATGAAAAPDIVNNFGKGLLEVRSALGPPPPIPVAPRVIFPAKARPPKLDLLPPARTPRGGLLFSMLMHSVIAPVVLWMSISFSVQAINDVNIDPDSERDSRPQPIFLPVLPAMPKMSPLVASNRETTQVAHELKSISAETAPAASSAPKYDFSGAQRIVSNPPHSTKGVQTILRPDLVSPPQLKFPLRLPSIFKFRAPAIPAPPRVRPTPSNPQNLALLPTNDPPIAKPALPVPAPRAPVNLATSRAPRVPAASQHAVPAPNINAEIGVPKAVAVINAVVVPPEPVVNIPEGELASRFSVGPSSDAPAALAAPESVGNVAGARASNPGENLSHSGIETGAGAGSKPGAVNAGSVTAGEPSSPSHPTAGSASGGAVVPGAVVPGAGVAAAGAKSLPGISISGGAAGSKGGVVRTAPAARGSYGLTIISGGNNGGASRDLGVFARTDTVYTVYIPMNDAGGGRDWSMQYTLMTSEPALNAASHGLLTPPLVIKKVQARSPMADPLANGGPVFVTGIIHENGKLQNVRAIRAADTKAQAAVNALADWEFEPARLNGNAVACKVLIGVYVIPESGVAGRP